MGGVEWRTGSNQLGFEVENMKHYGSSEFAHWKIAWSDVYVVKGGDEGGFCQLAFVHDVGDIHHGGITQIE